MLLKFKVILIRLYIINIEKLIFINNLNTKIINYNIYMDHNIVLLMLYITKQLYALYQGLANYVILIILIQMF